MLKPQKLRTSCPGMKNQNSKKCPSRVPSAAQPGHVPCSPTQSLVPGRAMPGAAWAGMFVLTLMSCCSAVSSVPGCCTLPVLVPAVLCLDILVFAPRRKKITCVLNNSLNPGARDPNFGEKGLLPSHPNPSLFLLFV